MAEVPAATVDNTRVLTAPLATIKIGGITVGKMKNIRISETYQRGDVKGIGSLISVEKPILAINCTFSASAFLIDITRFGNADNKLLRRTSGMSLQTFIDNILLVDSGVSIVLMRKVKTAATAPAAANGILTSTEVKDDTFLTIDNAFLDSHSFDISEGQISGQDISGTYLAPVML
jgi:hypothetical protein